MKMKVPVLRCFAPISLSLFFAFVSGFLMKNDRAHASSKPPAKTHSTSTHEGFSDLEIARIRAQMLLFREEAIALMPFAFEDDKEVQTPSRHAETLKSLDRFASNAAPMKHGELFKKNPMAQETFAILSHTLRESAFDFKNGRVSSSRSLLKASYHACLTCHASGLTKTAFDFGDVAALSAKTESPLRKAQINFVFRNFSQARTEARKALSDPVSGGAQKPFVAPWDAREAMEVILSAGILLQEPPSALGVEIASWQKTLVLPAPLATEVVQWKKEVAAWTRAPKSRALPSLAKLRVLVGLKKGEDLLPYQINLVSHLRARDALARLAGQADLNSEERAETMHLLGLIYRARDNDVFLGFADAYFASCIRLAPRTEIARGCFGSLKASLVESYTGTSGTHLGPEEKELLTQMGNLAGAAKPLP